MNRQIIYQPPNYEKLSVQNNNPRVNAKLKPLSNANRPAPPSPARRQDALDHPILGRLSSREHRRVHNQEDKGSVAKTSNLPHAIPMATLPLRFPQLHRSAASPAISVSKSGMLSTRQSTPALGVPFGALKKDNQDVQRNQSFLHLQTSAAPVFQAIPLEMKETLDVKGEKKKRKKKKKKKRKEESFDSDATLSSSLSPGFDSSISSDNLVDSSDQSSRTSYTSTDDDEGYTSHRRRRYDSGKSRKKLRLLEEKERKIRKLMKKAKLKRLKRKKLKKLKLKREKKKKYKKKESPSNKLSAKMEARLAAREARKPDEYGRYRTEYEKWHIIPWHRVPLPPEHANLWHSSACRIQRYRRRFVTLRKMKTTFKETQKAYKQVYASMIMTPIVDELLEQYLKEEFIPDILIEILTTNEIEFSDRPLLEMWCYDVCNSVVIETVEEESRKIISQVMRWMVSSYMTEQRLERNSKGQSNDFSLLTNEYIGDHIAEVAPGIVRDALGELVTDHFFTSQCDEFLEKALLPELKNVAIEAHFELSCENTCKSLIDETIIDIGKEIVSESIFDEERVGLQIRRKRDEPVIIKSCDRVVGRLLLQRLLQVLATRGEVLVMQGAMDGLLRMFIARKLMHKLQTIENRKAAYLENSTFQHMHEEVTKEIGFDLLLAMFIKSEEAENKLIDERDACHSEKIVTLK
eukprot:g1666.t1